MWWVQVPDEMNRVDKVGIFQQLVELCEVNTDVKNKVGRACAWSSRSIARRGIYCGVGLNGRCTIVCWETFWQASILLLVTPAAVLFLVLVAQVWPVCYLFRSATCSSYPLRSGRRWLPTPRRL
jgi:hypothetical protein